ncbi:MAG: hypothetical protein QM699_15310 [Amaricoccus sp.]|uniref:hypothetical protein n=1 Tax=Amaricoccus sp. TaxID=1872485 RepID=UPI0039E5BC02
MTRGWLAAMGRIPGVAALGAGALGVWIGAAGAVAAAGCDTPLDAALKLNDTPYHMKMTVTDASGGGAEVSELIATSDATYVRIGGTWHPGPKEDLSLGDADDMAEAEQNMTCRLARSETVAGVATDVWQIDDRSDPDEPKQQTVWIAQDDGRILRMEIVLTGDDDVGARTTAEIDYKNIQAPQ